jgi:predicted nucleic acid-binding protein
MNPSSVTSYIFPLLDAEFFSPEYVKFEFEKYKSLCLLKSKLSEQEFEIRRKDVEKSIKFVKLSDYKKFLKQATSILSDPKDSPYLALALSINAMIWSNDSDFKKQSLINALSTREIINKMITGEGLE